MSQQSFIISDGITDVAVDAGTTGLKTFIANTPTVIANAGTGTFTISGTVAATQSGTWTVQPGNTQNTTPWLTQDSADGPVAAGAAASKSILIGAQYNTSLPTLTNTQQAALQVDSSGRLLVGSIASALPTGANVIGAVTQSAGPWTQNITQFGSSNIATGTGASGSGIPRVTVANDSNILATQSGTWTVQQGNAPWSIVGIRTNNTAAPSSNHLGVLSAVASTASQSYTDGYQVLLSTDLSGHLRVTQGNAASLSNGWPVKLTDGSGNQIGTLSKTLYADPNGDRRTIHSNATLTSSGSTVLTWVGHSEWYLIINLKNAPTGSSPTIQFKIEQLDPIDQTTVLTGARVFTGTLKNSAGVDIIEIPELVSDTLKISWIITGGSPSWTGVNVTFCGHGAGNAIEGQADVGTIADDPPVPVAGVDGDGYIQYLNVDGYGNLKVITQNVSADAVTGVIFGRFNYGAGAGTLKAVRATTYTEQTVNFTGSVKSSSTNDTSAGTGARSVKITYYDQTGAGPLTETVTLNGTTAVNLVNTNHCFIEKMEVVTTGSLGANAGTISLFTGSGGTGTTVGSIGFATDTSGVGDNRTLWAHHYVAIGKTISLYSVTGGTTGNQIGIAFIKFATPLSSNTPEVSVSDYITIPSGGVFSSRRNTSPIELSGFGRVTIYVISNGTNTDYFTSFDYSEI